MPRNGATRSEATPRPLPLENLERSSEGVEYRHCRQGRGS
jgi:hypothetical protein